MRVQSVDYSDLLEMAARTGGVSAKEYGLLADLSSRDASTRLQNCKRVGLVSMCRHAGECRYFADPQAADSFGRTGHAEKAEDVGTLESVFGIRKPEPAAAKTQAISSVWRWDPLMAKAAQDMAEVAAKADATDDSQLANRDPQPAASLGWEVRQVGGQADRLDNATLDAVIDQATAPNVLEANDLICAINSRGELVIDLGEDTLIKFPPVQALSLHTFLVNTTILQNLQQRGLL
jgi:hypothetical protein